MTTVPQQQTPPPSLSLARLSKRIFTAILFFAASIYPLWLVALLACTAFYPREATLLDPWSDPAIRYSAGLSLGSSVVSGIISLILAVPSGYVLSRYRFPGWRVLDILLYLPIVLPGLVVGVGLLILFRTPPGRLIETYMVEFTFSVPGVVLAQTVVASAFAVRIVKMAFDAASRRRAGIARTLGASRWQAFWHIEFAEARGGLVEAFVLAWAVSLGAFGPIILFCGTMRGRTEVLSTSIFLEFSIGNLDRALILSVWMALMAAAVLLITRGWGKRPLW